jgi:hypothetical protein
VLTGKFVMRPRPRFWESLSSWRQRSALENGYLLYPVPGRSLRRVDPDRGADMSELQWLARTHDLSVQDVLPLTLREFEGKVYPSAVPRDHPNWLLRSRYTRQTLVPGPVFCPLCLSEENGEYFRLNWRIGFVTVCPRHLCEMLDQCTVCGAGVWPVGATSHPRFLEKKADSFGLCLSCGVRLGSLPVLEVTGGLVIGAWQDSLLAGDAQCIAPDTTVSSVDYLEALDVINHLFIRTSSRLQILARSGPWADLTRAIEFSGGENQVELLGLASRRALLRATKPLLSDWPSAFLDFTRFTGLTQEHMSDLANLMPTWMRNVIDGHLRRQRRVSAPMVLSTVDAMKAAGEKITQQAVRERVGSHAAAINLLLKRQQKANPSDLANVLDAMDQEIVYAPRQTHARKRNQVHVLLSIARGRPLAEVAEMRNSDIQSFLSLKDVRRPEQSLVHDRLERKWREFCASQKNLDPRALPFRSTKNTNTVRSAQRSLSRAMTGLEQRLWRNTSVFWRVDGKSGHEQS